MNHCIISLLVGWVSPLKKMVKDSSGTTVNLIDKFLRKSKGLKEKKGAIRVIETACFSRPKCNGYQGQSQTIINICMRLKLLSRGWEMVSQSLQLRGTLQQWFSELCILLQSFTQNIDVQLQVLR